MIAPYERTYFWVTIHFKNHVLTFQMLSTGVDEASAVLNTDEVQINWNNYVQMLYINVHKYIILMESRFSYGTGKPWH